MTQKQWLIFTNSLGYAIWWALKFPVAPPNFARLDYIFKKVKPKLIINALRGPSEDLIKTHKKSVLYCSNNNCRLLLISGSNVFDAFHNYPSYEYDKTMSWF